LQLGVTISCFSAAQMVGCRLLIALSSRVGRLTVMRACLAGAASASLLTALSTTWRGVTIARVLAGFFAASVPVAQAAVSDIMPPGTATSKALSRVASAASFGIVVGPAFADLVGRGVASCLGLGAQLQTRWAFGASAAFAVIVLMLSSGIPEVSHSPPGHRPSSAVAAAPPSQPKPTAPPAAAPWVQPLIRWVALVASWTFTMAVGVYALFAVRFLGYTQSAINATQSACAAVAIIVQLLLLPALVRSVGEHAMSAAGLAVLGACFAASSLVRVQPWHAALFLASRVGWACTEVTAAALTARYSTADERARNLGDLQSTQAAARIVTPLIGGKLYELSLAGTRMSGPPGALPFLAVGLVSLLTAPAPLLLQRFGVTRQRSAPG